MQNPKHNFKRVIALQSIQFIIARFHVKRCSSRFWSDSKGVPEFPLIFLFSVVLMVHLLLAEQKRRFVQKSFFEVEDPNACSLSLTSWFLMWEVVPLASISRFSFGWTLGRVPLSSISVLRTLPRDCTKSSLKEINAITVLWGVCCCFSSQSFYLLHPGFHVI